VDALIVGAGIGGLTAAIAVRRAGLRPIVLERAERFAPVGAGISVFPNAVHGLRGLGLAERIDSVPALRGAARVHTWRGAPITSADAGSVEERFGAPLLILHRAALHELLLDAVGPDVVRLGAEVTGFEQDASGVAVRLASGAVVRGAVLVGADGLRSVVRSAVIGDGAPRYAGYLAWRGVAEEAGPVGEFWGPGAVFGAVPLPGGLTYWFGTKRVPAGGQDTADERKAEALAMFADWAPSIPALIEATPADAILRNDICDRTPRRGWSQGRVTLLGDAAHPMTPHLGQGACQAIEDAVALGACLSGSDSVPGALADYEGRRRGRTARLVRLSRTAGRIAQTRNPLVRAARDAVLRRMSPEGQLRALAPIVGGGVRSASG
jgi:2-polyprenyl-6-methoxyphenol hydroxylase-like FAD-dependent oxidoreductase